ncbi:hypothetical protein [African swine fever virus]|nr:hypothetical protein [African swine fever virus]
MILYYKTYVHKMIILIFLIFSNIVLSIDYWVSFNKTIILDSNITNDNNDINGVSWNFFNNSFNTLATCGKAGNFCECSNYSTSIYNITNNCSLTIFPHNDVFDTTYQVVWNQIINYTIKLLTPATPPNITYNCTNFLITCKKIMEQTLIYI